MISDKIQQLIAKYNTTDLDAINLPELMKIRKELVCLGLSLGVDVARYKRDYDAAYARRKIEYFREKNYNIEKGVGKAEVLAEVEIGELRKEERTNESLYMGTKIILNQLNEVLSSLSQDISVLRTEFKES